MQTLCLAFRSEADRSLARPSAPYRQPTAVAALLAARPGRWAAWQGLAATAQGNAFGAALPPPVLTAPVQLVTVQPSLPNGKGGRGVLTEK